MILESWNKIAYTVQLLISCIIFMIPVRKKKFFPLLAGITAVVLTGFSYVVNSVYRQPSTGVMLIVYWALYILICIFFVWLCLEASILQAVYCAICACGVQHIAFDLYLIYIIAGGKSEVISLVIYVVIYILFYLFFARNLPERERFSVNRQALFPITTMFLLVWILSVLEKSMIAGFEDHMWQRIIYRVIDGMCCFYVLWVQINQKERMSLQRELDSINSIWRQQKKQYEVTSETIESINRKCHDLKYQIGMLRRLENEQEKQEFLSEIESDIMIYDTALKTGNKALDTVLMEKGLFCKNHGIQWSCMADGAKLDFMKLEDIYSVFGNALDNAIEAVIELEEAQKKIISVKIITQKNILVIQVQNYYNTYLHFEKELPVTTKKNKKDHGYGMKSIRYTAEKYNGTITVQANNGIFMLQVLIPVE